MRPVVPSDGMSVREDTLFAPGVYHLPHGIHVEADGITLDGGGALIVGGGGTGSCVTLRGRSGVTIRHLRASEFYYGIHAESCRGLSLTNNQVASTVQIAPNTIFLDIWLGPEAAYGGGIFLRDVVDSRVEGNDLRYQQNGLLTYHCRQLSVRRNQASYNSGFGFHLYGTCDSTFEENCADYCCRFEPREGGRHYGHMGADATGFLAVHGSSRNTFTRNTARMGGDGFFLAGLSPEGKAMGCDENLFVENDASLSPNIAFEATFCRGNVFRDNYADRCNYGFWLGFSWDTQLTGNRMVLNRQAGVAVENGHGIQVRDNTFQGNGHGVLIWTRHVEQFSEIFPLHDTSYDWCIERNRFTRNGTGVRIASDQDHGIQSLPADAERPVKRPRDHTIRGNDIQDNRIGIDLLRTDRTVMDENILNRNVEANLRQDDCDGTVARNNPGSAGGYL